MTYSLTYVSQATTQFSDSQLKVLSLAAQERNLILDVTGALAYSNGWFIQVLEGDKTKVKGLYDTIARDPRHTHLTIVIDDEVAARSFADWSMAVIRSSQTENDTLRNVYHIARRAESDEKFDSVDALHAFIAPPRLAIQGNF
jgi:Sensors of blue-light using FAD